jgi:4-amino-4-deoxy-L-arabinose transferase-like glycosyltransferase
MTYHLARTVSWVSHGSIEHFPTTITRQLYQPPFAEYVLLHINVLSRGDHFSAAVQFFFFLFSLIAIAGIVQTFGLTRKHQLTATALAATIPEVVLQASSTQNDIVVSFFILASFYCAVKAIRVSQFKYYLFFGIAAGLALLTKGTAYIYLAPVFLIFAIAVIIRLFKTHKASCLIYGMAVGFIVVLINAGYYYRNYRLDQNILGADKIETRQYANQQMSLVLLASNIIKNAGLHFGLMYAKPISVAADSAIHKLYVAAGININDPEVNYRRMKYGIIADTGSEDSAPNLLHFLLMLSAFIILLYHWRKWKDKPEMCSLITIVILQVLFFCLYLKWQPWNSRLHVPIFLMATPLICCAFSLSGTFKKLAFILLPILLAYAFLTAWHNEWRPISSKIYKEGRYQKYFASKPGAYPEYDAISKTITQNHFKNIGLIIGLDDWEYPLFTACYNTELNPIHINVTNVSAKTGNPSPNADCIISTTINKPFIDYNNKRYFNHDSGNKIIYLYSLKL